VRVEDASLLELCGMAGEILEGRALPPGGAIPCGISQPFSKGGNHSV